MQDIPEEMIKSMDYATRQRNFQQELSEKLATMGRLPLWKYDQVIKELPRNGGCDGNLPCVQR